MNLSGNNGSQSVEIPSINFEIRGYQRGFSEWLESAKDFPAFKNKVSQELKRLGFFEWSYSRIDVPISFVGEKFIGTITNKLTDMYMQEAFYEYDLIHRHVQKSRAPVFRSAVDVFLANTPIESDDFQRNKDLSKMYDCFGYMDHCTIPLYANDGNNHAVFVLINRTNNSDEFKRNISFNLEKLYALIESFEDVGIRKFSNYFLGPKKTYEELAFGESIKLLEEMSRNDLKVYQAAERLNMSRDVADKHLARLRAKLDATTNLAVLSKAISIGIISPPKVIKYSNKRL